MLVVRRVQALWRERKGIAHEPHAVLVQTSSLFLPNPRKDVATGRTIVTCRRIVIVEPLFRVSRSRALAHVWPADGLACRGGGLMTKYRQLHPVFDFVFFLPPW